VVDSSYASSSLSDPATHLPDLVASGHMTLVEQVINWARLRIDDGVFRAGMRMPSVRQLAADKRISRFTVVEAYERLVALSWQQSMRRLARWQVRWT
jgi:DNA-binding transcriptional MocR family regulator